MITLIFIVSLASLYLCFQFYYYYFLFFFSDSVTSPCLTYEIFVSPPFEYILLLFLTSSSSPLIYKNNGESYTKLTCMCLHSWPLAGSVIRLKVIGHFNETLIAVCSTPSSPLNELDGTLLKFLLTEKKNNINIIK